jgi:hypothetical protein
MWTSCLCRGKRCTEGFTAWDRLIRTEECSVCGNRVHVQGTSVTSQKMVKMSHPLGKLCSVI